MLVSAFWSRRPFAEQPGAEPHREHADKCRQGRESTPRRSKPAGYDPLSGLPHIQAYRLSADQYRPDRQIRSGCSSPVRRRVALPSTTSNPSSNEPRSVELGHTDWPTVSRHRVAVDVSGRPVRGSPRVRMPSNPTPPQDPVVGRDDLEACACCWCRPSGAGGRLRSSPALSRIESTPTNAGRAAKAHRGARSRQGTTLYRACLTYRRTGCPPTSTGPTDRSAPAVPPPFAVGSLSRARPRARRATSPAAWSLDTQTGRPSPGTASPSMSPASAPGGRFAGVPVCGCPPIPRPHRIQGPPASFPAVDRVVVSARFADLPGWRHALAAGDFDPPRARRAAPARGPLVGGAAVRAGRRGARPPLPRVRHRLRRRCLLRPAPADTTRSGPAPARRPTPARWRASARRRGAPGRGPRPLAGSRPRSTRSRALWAAAAFVAWIGRCPKPSSGSRCSSPPRRWPRRRRQRWRRRLRTRCRAVRRRTHPGHQRARPGQAGRRCEDPRATGATCRRRGTRTTSSEPLADT